MNDLYIKMSVNHICEYQDEYVFDFRMNGKISGLFVLRKHELDRLDDLFK